jgi:hypothetical protein
MTGTKQTRTEKRIAKLTEDLSQIAAGIDEQMTEYRLKLVARNAGKMAAKHAELAVLRDAVAELKPVE